MSAADLAEEIVQSIALYGLEFLEHIVPIWSDAVTSKVFASLLRVLGPELLSDGT